MKKWQKEFKEEMELELVLRAEKFIIENPKIASAFIDYVQNLEMKHYMENQQGFSKLQKKVDKQWKKKK